jgi:lipopolysaccharide export system permease protein
MGTINRYVFRTTLSTFVVVLISLTAIIWVTQALHDFDLVTSQGATIVAFLGITVLLVPTLVLVIAPIALLIAAVHVLNKLSTDSEIVVVNAAGISPWVLFRSFVVAALTVSLLVTAIDAYFGPKGLRLLREWITEVRANVVSSIVQPGRFTKLENDVTIHIRQRGTHGRLLGIFLDDRRNPAERLTVLAEDGELVDNDKGTFLILQHGLVQRQAIDRRDPAMVAFDRYAFDLSQFANGPQAVQYTIRERYLWQLLSPDPNDKLYVQQPGQFRAELYNRLMAPLYPIVFTVIAFAYLGAPRTTRQSRTLSILGAVGWVMLLRLIGFASSVFGVNHPALLSLQFIAAAAGSIAGIWAIRRGLVLEPPAFVSAWLAPLAERLSRHLATS